MKYFGGCDVGSTYTKCVILDEEGKDEIAAGIQQAVAKRCFVMAKKAGATDAITLTGGCAKNEGLKKAIDDTGYRVLSIKTEPYKKKGFSLFGR